MVAIDGPSGPASRRCHGVSRPRSAHATWTPARCTGRSPGPSCDAGIDPTDAAAVAASVGKITIDSGTDPSAPHISVDGRPVDVEIRGPEVTGAVSAVAAVPAGSRALVAQQREIIAAAGPDRGRGPRHRLDGRAGCRAEDLSDRLRGGACAPSRTENAGGAVVRVRRSPPPKPIWPAAITWTAPVRPTAAPADGAIEVDTTGLDIDGVVAALVELLPAGVDCMTSRFDRTYVRFDDDDRFRSRLVQRRRLRGEEEFLGTDGEVTAERAREAARRRRRRPSERRQVDAGQPHHRAPAGGRRGHAGRDPGPGRLRRRMVRPPVHRGRHRRLGAGRPRPRRRDRRPGRDGRRRPPTSCCSSSTRWSARPTSTRPPYACCAAARSR